MKTNREIDCGTPSLEKLSRSFLIILATYKITFKLKEIRGYQCTKAEEHQNCRLKAKQFRCANRDVAPLNRIDPNGCLKALWIPWVPEVFFSLGATELRGEAAKASCEAARKKPLAPTDNNLTSMLTPISFN